MAEISFEAKTEHAPRTLTEKVDAALGYDYEQARQDVMALAQTTSELAERIRGIQGGETDARLGALVVMTRLLADADFHMRHGDELAHQDTPPSDVRSS